MSFLSSSQPDNTASTPDAPARDWRFFLVYDILIMLLIVINLLTITVDHLLFTHIGMTVANFIHEGQWVTHYQNQIHPVIRELDEWVTIYLISELMVRWLISIMLKHHDRWFFFPFIHWYEFLACIPTFRALRLLRAIVIGYRLYQMGYRVIPQHWLTRGKFYYGVIMEELSDRIVITVLNNLESELKTHSTGRLTKQLIDQHRTLLTNAIAETLQHNLAAALTQQQATIIKGVGDIVSQAIVNTPELHNILRLFPVIGSRLEQQIQSIGQRLGENITTGLLDAFNQPARDQLANPALQTAASYVGNIDIDQPELKKLVESLVFNSIDTIRDQVRIQQWKVEQAVQQDLARTPPE